MANSTWLQATNRILAHAGQDEIADATTFNDKTKLDKPQYQAKLFTDFASRHIVTSGEFRFLQREFSLSLVDNDQTKPLATNSSAERIIQKTWRVTTAGKGRILRERRYIDQITMFPEGETSKGTPDFYYLLPPDSNGADYVGFSPIPNASINIKYLGYLKAIPLALATDAIQWPDQYEDRLWVAGQTFLEMVLAEGKMPDIGQFLEPYISELRQISGTPASEMPTTDLGIGFDPMDMGLTL